jgi:hypothetical protein
VLSAGGKVVQWSSRTGRLQVEWQAERAPQGDLARSVAAGQDDGLVVVATARRRFLVLDLTTGKQVAEFEGPPTRSPGRLIR